ncbi:MAG: SurA N-terminal domain-containing protein [Nanoarchaeota archaeon]
MAKKANEDEDSMFYEDLDEDEGDEDETPKKKPKKKKEESNMALYIVVGIIVVVAVVLIILYADKLFPKQQPEQDKQVAALVNGKEILLAEVDKQFDAIPESYRTLYPKTVVLDQIISRELLLQEAAAKGIVTADEEVTALINSMKAQFPSEADFNALLAQQNLTIEELSKQLKNQLTISKLLNQSVFQNLMVSEAEIKAYFDENAAGENVTLDEVREDINTILLFDKQKDAYNRFIDQLRTKATIVNYLNQSQVAPPAVQPVDNTTAAPPATPTATEAAACTKNFGLSSQAVIYYTASADWCVYCKQADTAVNKLISEGKSFHIADITVKVGLDVVNTCFKAKMREGVPQFVCAGSGQVKEGSLSEQELRDFVAGCT